MRIYDLITKHWLGSNSPYKVWREYSILSDLVMPTYRRCICGKLLINAGDYFAEFHKVNSGDPFVGWYYLCDQCMVEHLL